ncbi:unnamed protein product [Gongylonema pulchrum]|uniref:Secreted protein n=1 Tax=Gongylonema pulchrum TaxID=637853 RepID=A0A183DI51_9BILA|nr:unnamed protein product [Gongylonema pulchrum]
MSWPCFRTSARLMAIVPEELSGSVAAVVERFKRRREGNRTAVAGATVASQCFVCKITVKQTLGRSC